jgi:hypothetical protein
VEEMLEKPCGWLMIKTFQPIVPYLLFLGGANIIDS